MNPQPEQPLGVLLSRALTFYREHFWLLVVVTLPVVAFVDVVITAGLGLLTAAPNKVVPVAQQVADGDIFVGGALLVTIPLVTAMLARAVVIVARGESPRAVAIAVEGLELFGPVFFVVVMLWACVIAGLSLLAIPSIFVLVSWWFAVQAVAIDRCRWFAAIRMSATLVRGRWWRTAGVGVGFVLACVIPALPILDLFEWLADAAHSDALVVTGLVLIDTLALPFIAVGATLYYLELRELHGMPAPR
ncbi:MAG: hypothetical protein ABSG64_12145 [Solirubrobacteraceae bacterium]|jgi:hypothetical protein